MYLHPQRLAGTTIGIRTTTPIQRPVIRRLGSSYEVRMYLFRLQLYYNILVRDPMGWLWGRGKPSVVYLPVRVRPTVTYLLPARAYEYYLRTVHRRLKVLSVT